MMAGVQAKKGREPLASAPSGSAAQIGDKDEQVIALPLFLGQRTARQFRWIFGSVLAITLPLALGLWIQEYLDEKNSAPRILASIGLVYDSHALEKATVQLLQGTSAETEDVSRRAITLEQSLRTMRPHPVYSHIFGVSREQSACLEAIAEVVSQAKGLAQLASQAPNARATQARLLGNLQQRTVRFTEALRAAMLRRPFGSRAVNDPLAWEAFATIATRSAQWAKRLETPQEIDGVLQEMPSALATFRQNAQALIPALAKVDPHAPFEWVTSSQVAALMQTAQSLGELVQTAQMTQNALAKTQTIPTTFEHLNEQLGTKVETLYELLHRGRSGDNTMLLVNVLLRTLVLVSIVGWLYVLLASRDYLHAQSEKARHEANLRMQWAESAAEEANKMNEVNQLAIIRLMQELQDIASGNLTKRATVSEDLTGGIADAINFTVAELRELVIGVQATASRVTATTAQVDAASLVVLESSRKQLAEIRRTGQSVLQLAQRVGAISALAETSAMVARQSRTAAESGRMAVQDAIGSIDKLREHIHETSKRIKRLGESSQEIGEITSLLSDITTQTNLLALNAAIQATAAGEAGRGFAVVAEEVGQLAERSAQAARKISVLVAGIQTDAQNAIGAMERSALGVVEGARLSDRAGLTLTDIDRLSREVTAHVERISDVATQESQSASVIAKDIQSIFTLTEQNTQGTLINAEKVHSLSTAADNLMKSVARFSLG